MAIVCLFDLADDNFLHICAFSAYYKGSNVSVTSPLNDKLQSSDWKLDMLEGLGLTAKEKSLKFLFQAKLPISE